MNTLRSVIEENDTVASRAFNLFIQSLIVISLVTFSLETLPDLDRRFCHILSIVERVTIYVFTLEYLLRIAVSRHKLGFIFSFYGLVDAFAILPFYVASGIDLRSIRTLRLIRLVRILKLLRFSRAINRFKVAFISISNELAVFFIATAFLLYISGIGIYYFENAAQPEHFRSIFHSLWWAIITLTTVGYGDVYPVTVGGRVFTFLILMVGLGVIAIPTGLISSALSDTIAEEKPNSHQPNSTKS